MIYSIRFSKLLNKKKVPKKEEKKDLGNGEREILASLAPAGAGVPLECGGGRAITRCQY